jgi:tuberculosinol/isotuberculosinol synthase
MDAETFQSLPTVEVARLVRQTGPKVCVFPLKGTRRWFTLEHPSVRMEDFAPAYTDAIAKRSIELYRLIFDHGLDTLLMPSFSPDLMARGEDYMRMAAATFKQLIGPDFQDFYHAYQVRLRFYGEYRKFFERSPYAHLLDVFDQVTAQTMAYERHRLFLGMFAHEPIRAIAELTVRYYLEHGHTPDKRALIEGYYGEYVEPVDLFIGFGKLRAFDMPLVMTGREDLYFMLTPSPYLSAAQLRDILYDHLYARTKTRGDLRPDQVRDIADSRRDLPTRAKTELQPQDWDLLRRFYQANQGKTLGIGIKQRHRIWYPLPQVELPEDFELLLNALT